MTAHEEMKARLNPHGLNVTDVIVQGTGIQRRWLKVFRVKQWSAATCWAVIVACMAGMVMLAIVMKARL